MRNIRLVTVFLSVCAALFFAAPAFAVPALTDLAIDPNPILVNGTSTGTVTLSEPAASDTVVTLSANPANAVTIPATVTVPTGQSQAGFQIQDMGVASTTTISATLGAVTINRDLHTVTSLPHLVINEVDYDQAGTDAKSFLELFNASPDDADLNNLAVVFVNGATNTEYLRVDLSSLGCLASGGYLVIGNDGVVIPQGALFISKGTGDWIQNGAPDGVALVDTAHLTLLDTLSYEGSITAAQITGFPGTYLLVEGTPFAGADTNDDLNSLSRTPNGQDTDDAAADWALASPSPGSPNGVGAASVPGVCNEPPVLDAIGDRSVTAGQTLSFTISGTDPDSDPLTFSAANLPFGSTFDAGTRTFSWTPTAAQVGTYAQVHFETTDGQASDSEDIAITVNAAPVVTGSTTPTSSGGSTTTSTTTTTTTGETPQPGAAGATLDTKIAKVKVKRRTATVTFSGTGADGFQCKLDKGRFAACRSPKAYKKLKRGKHTVQVRALDAAGKPDPTPAKTTFRVRR